MRPPWIVLSCVIVLPLLGGCAGPGSQAPPQEYLSRQAALIEDVNGLRGEVQAIKAVMDERGASLKATEESSGTLSSRLNELEKKISGLEQSIERQGAVWDKKMQAVIDIVKSENAQLRRAVEKSMRRNAGARSEHTVSPGETLADIAKKYGVRTREIIELNELKDPDRIQAGRKLIIPARPRD